MAAILSRPQKASQCGSLGNWEYTQNEQNIKPRTKIQFKSNELDIMLFGKIMSSSHGYTSHITVILCRESMMTSSNGSIFRVTGPLCGEFTGPGEFPTQRPVTRSFDVIFDLRLNKRLSKQPGGWWFETLSWSLWRQCNATSRRRIDSSRKRPIWKKYEDFVFVSLKNLNSNNPGPGELRHIGAHVMSL